MRTNIGPMTLRSDTSLRTATGSDLAPFKSATSWRFSRNAENHDNKLPKAP